jgi:uncharacterized protein
MIAALALVLAVAAPQGWVTDEARVLTPQEQQQLESKLEALQARTGHQFVVYVGRSLGQQPIEDFAERTFGQWQIGRKGLDDGAALFVFLDDRKARIEVGYGLEPTLTDVASARIIRDVLAPRMRAGDPGGAITATVDAVIAQLGAGPSPPPPPPEKIVAEQRAKRWVLGAGAIAFLLLFLFNPRVALILLAFSTGRGGGGWGGNRRGGGFSGGGGRSGGAGATGGW